MRYSRTVTWIAAIEFGLQPLVGVRGVVDQGFLGCVVAEQLDLGHLARRGNGKVPQHLLLVKLLAGRRAGRSSCSFFAVTGSR